MAAESLYAEEITDLICARIADGQSLRKICLEPGMPGRQTVLDWLEAHEPFRAKYARARERQAECMLEMQLEVAQDCTEDNAHACRVKIGTYQWVASKLAPKKYGDRVVNQNQQLDANGNPITPGPTFVIFPDGGPGSDATPGKSNIETDRGPEASAEPTPPA
jgi:hypothetical protein